MSGFALIFDSQRPIDIQNKEFLALTDAVVDYKQLNSACSSAAGQHCVAAKFDTASTLHQGIIRDQQSGSWLLAAGTVLDTHNNSQDGNLQALLTDYLEHGSVVLQNLDGPFALVIYNNLTNTLAIVSDPFGFISIFYAQWAGKTYVATSALAIARVGQATPSEQGVYLFLTTGMVLDDLTLWREVKRLGGGRVLEIRPDRINESVYWSPSFNSEIAKLSLNDTVDCAYNIFTNLTKKHLAREGKTWLDLTGGFDSRLVAVLMDHCGLPFKGNCQGPNDSPDVRIAADIARQMNWEFQHFSLPDDWGQQRAAGLDRALGKGDGHLDLFKLAGVLWNQDQRALEYNTPIWGLGGELWRGTIWKQELWNVGRSQDVNYDRLVDYRLIGSADYTVLKDRGRVEKSREDLKSLLQSVGDKHPNLPNTFKLDCIFAYKTTGHTGSHISAVMGQQRAIAPLFFKEGITFAVSTHYKWRNHSRLVRLLLEKINPAVANIRTTAGGPAVPMRIDNIHKFKPYWTVIGKQLVRKASRKAFGRSLLPEARSELNSYPLTQWRHDTLAYLEGKNVLDYAQMRSAKLYDPEGLKNLVDQVHTENFKHETFLSRMITVEMALRSVGASF